MRKAIKKLGVLALSAFIIIIMTGCGKSNEGIVGEWNYYDSAAKNAKSKIYYTFNKDNTGSYTFYDDTKKFKYETKDGKVIISYENATVPNEFEYSIKDDILTIKDSFGADVTYKRK